MRLSASLRLNRSTQVARSSLLLALAIWTALAVQPLLASYSYDALGRRIVATIGAVTTRYYYDGQNIIEERDGSDVRVRYHVNGAQFIDERVATFEDSNGAFTYYLLKENFSVAGTANADGSTIERLDYSATGSFAGSGGGIDVDYNDDGYVDADDLAEFETCASGPTIPQNDPNCADKKLDADADVDQTDFGLFQRCYSGDQLASPGCTSAGGGLPASGTFVLHGRPVDVLPDGHTLLFVRARFYDLKDGRWLQRDPTGFADGPNLYESFKGNPARYTDPKGLDSIETEGEGDLVYKGDGGFIWMFARNVSPDLVLIDHPDWPYAFIVKRRLAISEFQRSWLGALWYGDRFSHPLEIMQYATALASRSSARANIIKIFDKHAPTLGWIDPGEVTTGARAEAYHALAQGGLQQMVGEVGQLTQTAFVVTTGALAAPTGAGGVIVDVVSAGTDVATGKASVGTGAVVVIAAAGGALLHLRFADDSIGPVAPRLAKGPYSQVGGHHIHAKAAFRGLVAYDPQQGFAISEQFMRQRGWRHPVMTTKQRELFLELARSGRPNTLKEHSRIAVEAMKAAGASDSEARSLVAESLRNLREQGVRVPTDIPWAPQ